MILAANSEMNAELTEEGEVKISGKPVKQEIMPFGGDGEESTDPKEAESTAKPIDVVDKSGDKRYTVIEHK